MSCDFQPTFSVDPKLSIYLLMFIDYFCQVVDKVLLMNCIVPLVVVLGALVSGPEKDVVYGTEAFSWRKESV